MSNLTDASACALASVFLVSGVCRRLMSAI